MSSSTPRHRKGKHAHCIEKEPRPRRQTRPVARPSGRNQARTQRAFSCLSAPLPGTRPTRPTRPTTSAAASASALAAHQAPRPAALLGKPSGKPTTRRVHRRISLGCPRESTAMSSTEVLLREKQVLATVAPVHRTTWWRWVKNGLAPKPVSIGPRSTAWRQSDLVRWQRGEWKPEEAKKKPDLPNPA